MPTPKINESVQEGVLKVVETTQRLTLEAVTAMFSTFDGILPKETELPFAKFIDPKATIESGFAFAEKLLETQKSFINELVTITQPSTAPAAAAKRATA